MTTVKQHLNKRYIAPELRDNELDEIDLLLCGETLCVEIEQLNDIINGINKLDINTLMIQKSDEFYYIKVDELTMNKMRRKLV